MSRVGKFIKKKFINRKLELFIGVDNEWLAYADGEVQAYTIIIVIPIDYDEETGILTLKNDDNQVIYIAEESIAMFWTTDSGFKLIENTNSTIRAGKSWLKKGSRDIM